MSMNQVVLLASCLAFSLTLKMEPTRPPKTSVDYAALYPRVKNTWQSKSLSLNIDVCCSISGDQMRSGLFQLGRIEELSKISLWPGVASLCTMDLCCVAVCCSISCRQGRTLSSNCGSCPRVGVSLHTLVLVPLVSSDKPSGGPIVTGFQCCKGFTQLNVGNRCTVNPC
jgi:hypothetical protein